MYDQAAAIELDGGQVLVLAFGQRLAGGSDEDFELDHFSALGIDDLPQLQGRLLSWLVLDVRFARATKDAERVHAKIQRVLQD